MSLAPTGGNRAAPRPYSPSGRSGTTQWLPPPIPAAEQGNPGPWYGPSGPYPAYHPPVYPVTQPGPPQSAAPSTVRPPPIPSGQWKTQIENDPLYKLAVEQSNAARQASIQGLRAAQQRALIQFGEAPTLPNGLGFDLTNALDPTTKSLIQQNTAAHLSTTSQIQDQYDQGYKSAINNLAARGLLHSGSTGYQANLLQRGLTQARYGATQQLLDALTGQWGGYAASEGGRQNDLLTAMNATLSRILAYPEAYGQTANPVAMYTDSQAGGAKPYQYEVPQSPFMGGYGYPTATNPYANLLFNQSGGRRGGV